jgi:hypothetical protein
MKIHLGGLWSGVKRRELDELVAKPLRGPWYRLHMPRGQLASCELLELTDLQAADAREYCAVLDIQPARLGWEVMQYLDGLRVHGVTLKAHKWFPRHGVEDRRDGLGLAQAELARDRRAGQDRRRKLQIEPLGASMVRAVRGFERSYGA